MREALEAVVAWRRAGVRAALATVVAVEGSGPREPGTMMAVSERAEVVGSVSGGCVEGAVVAEALARLDAPEAVLASIGITGSVERGAATLAFGYSDDEAIAVGLTCGGTFHILVDPDPPDFLDEVVDAIGHGVAASLAFVWQVDSSVDDYFAADHVGVAMPKVGATLAVLGDGRRFGSLGNESLDRVVAREAAGAIDAARGTRRELGRLGETRSREVSVVLAVEAPPPTMVVLGAVDFADALARTARLLGYRVLVVDARALFATRERFPMADEVVVAWPHAWLEAHRDEIQARDAICVLTHDPKFDVPAIQAALATRAGYIGVMGSRRTQRDRRERLREAGVDLDEVDARVAAPIGLDLGARTPEETAIAIVAEIIARREGRSGTPLSATDGDIHAAGAFTW
ncbi:protein of unknown function DUF182 [Acidimicrobium ferrooxidans DSM 10331]|uniref:Xanthine dehydrogenase n=1 Tax=Acidimicrobium ferrooxidans (strain DSM 10331 / JCM 15462 / NBRC 103882 / ICP) TaxID=525909 RepID=C7M0H9_ACIFD|nr:XdhC/CoxI family protein [Acidimicrobium ferrooxidans]ACU54487.1 protein of unknown function DUF182 [Acidimicrobium ferrooxidans DSM 10331]